MHPDESLMPREEIWVPSPRRLTLAERTAKAVVGAALAPMCWGIAHAWPVPGLGYQRRCAVLGLRLLAARPTRASLRWAYDLLVRPMDSTRYFEHAFVWDTLHPLLGGARHLDVSSPRLVAIMLLTHNRALTSEMINPDRSDLEQSRQLVSFLGLSERCRLHESTISDAPFGPEEFDLVTCVSVLEHILEDRHGLSAMWRLLRRGGRLVVTVPIKARRSEQWINRDIYGLQVADERGFTFWQRFYDDELLHQSIYSFVGEPRRIAVYGEKRRGTFLANAQRKRGDPFYPFWAEAIFMGREFRFWPSVDSLPGEGVAAMEFVKP